MAGPVHQSLAIAMTLSQRRTFLGSRMLIAKPTPVSRDEADVPN